MNTILNKIMNMAGYLPPSPLLLLCSNPGILRINWMITIFTDHHTRFIAHPTIDLNCHWHTAHTDNHSQLVAHPARFEFPLTILPHWQHWQDNIARHSPSLLIIFRWHFLLITLKWQWSVISITQKLHL
jgi:hypothetical protein